MSPLPIEEACDVCGYVHHKKSGDLKYYVGAMQCHAYVSLLLEEQSTWGMASRAPARGDMTEVRLYACHAPAEFRCWHKGSPGTRGRPACMSPDGFPSEVHAHEKVKLMNVPHDQFDFSGAPSGEQKTWVVDDSKACPHRKTARRKRVEKTGEGLERRAKAGKGYREPPGNRMPGGGNQRKERVFSELQRRIDHLRGRGERVTPEAIAKLGGFTERAA